MKRKITPVCVLICILIWGNFSFSQEDSISGEIKLIAHYKERLKEWIIATGNVEIHYKSVKLFADSVKLNTETKDVTAEGNVVIQLPNENISGEKASFNLDSSIGEIKKVHGMVQPTIFYEAESLERKSESVYHFQKAWITSCTQPVPRWKFSCSKADFRKNDYVAMWSSVLFIKKVPVFYFPYIRYPLNEERATGFLMPQLGYSGIKGLTYSQSFYWAIRRNMDATLNLNYYSEKGLGGGLEYRYLFSEGTGGQLNLYYFNFKNTLDQEEQPNAYIFRFSHNQPLPLNFKLVANVDYQSSFDFLRQFDNNFVRAVVSNRSSQVYLSRSWSYFNLNARASRFETFFMKTNNSIIRHYLPQIGFSSSKIKILSPLYFSFSSSFTRWEYGWESDYENNTQRSSQDCAFNPAFTIPFTAVPWFTLNSSISSNINYYFKSYAPNTKTIVDDPVLSHKHAVNFEFIGPVFYRIFFGADKTPKLKHIIEPSVVYRYETPNALSDRIITASGYYFRYHKVTYGITNRFLLKQAKMTKEIFTLGISQTYYLLPEESPLQPFLVDDEIPRFTDISSYLRFYPKQKYSIDVSAGFNPYYKTLSSIRMGANFGVPEDPVFLRVNWYKSINPYYKNILYDRHQISCFSGANIPRLSMEAVAEVDFNIKEKKLLYSAFSLIYHYQCLDFTADVRVFYFREKPETYFRISIGLGNIGKTTDFLGGLGF